MAAKKNIDWYLLLLVVFCLLFMIYWISYQVYRYRDFGGSFWDLGQETYNMYLHLHYSNILYGLQFLSFSNHIEPFKLLILPIFALYQSPVTLLVLQDLALALAAIVAYFIGKDIIHNKYVGFALALAFLLSAGVRGIVYFDLHIEAFIPLFYLLCFYFYMKNRSGYFLLSFILMLSTIDTSLFAAAPFLAGMLLYELFYGRGKNEKESLQHKKRLRLIAISIVISLIFLLFYEYTITTLLMMYQKGYYQSLPQSIRVVNFLNIQSSAAINPGAVSYMPSFLIFFALWGFLILFLGFGITSFKNIFLTIVLLSGWIFEIFVVHNLNFGKLFTHYYAYTIGGAVVASAIGFILISRRKENSHGIKTAGLMHFLANLTIVISIIISALLFFGIANYPITVLNPLNWHSFANYSQIDTALNSIPRNSTVLAQPSMAAQLYKVLYLELPPDDIVYGFNPTGFNTNINISTFYAKPTYVVVDNSIYDFQFYYENQTFNIYSYLRNNYTLWNSTDGLEIYKLKSN